MATEWISPTWRMPQVNNQSKFENYSLDFDGTEYIDLGSDSTLEITSDFSVSVWIKDSASINRGIFCCGDRNLGSGWHIYRTSTNKVAFNLYTANSKTATGTTSINTGDWFHIVATFEKNGTASEQIKIYVNTVEDGKNGWISAQTPSYSGTIYKQIAYPYAGVNEFLGSISTPVVFDYLLSSTQISYLYNSGTPQNPMAISGQPPIAYYPLGGSSTGSASTLTVPNESVADATVFNFDDAASQFVVLPQNSNTIPNPTGYTFSGWFNPSDLSGATTYRTLYSTDAGTGVVIWLYGAGFYIYQRYSGTWVKLQMSALTAGLEVGKWFHFAVSWDGSDKIKAYINGIFKQEQTGAGGIDNPSPPYAGNYPAIGDYSGYTFDGQISNFQIYDTNLTDGDVSVGNVATGQIAELYNNGVPPTTAVASSNLKAWYPMNVENANWLGSDWQIAEATSAYPQSFDFDGSTPDLINCGNSTDFDFATQITISAWVKTTDQDSINNIVKKDNGGSNRGWNLSWRGSSGGGSRLVFWNWSTDGTYNYLYTTGTPASNFADGNWHHVVVTYDGTADASGAKIYLDGSLMSQGAVSRAGTGLKITTEPVEIGGGISGNISNIQLFNTALPATGTDSVETLYNNGSPLTTAIASSNLKAWYKLDNTATFSTNWSIPDASGNGNTATSSGMTEQNLVNNNVSALNGTSSGMTTANLVNSDLTRSIPYSSYSMDFDGTNDNISTSGPIVTSGALSFSCWFKTSDTTSNQVIWNSIDSTTAKSFLRISGTALRLKIIDGSGGNNNIDNTVTTADGNWHHIAFTSDGLTTANGVIVYLDGAPLGTTGTLSNAGFASTTKNQIGSYAPNAQNFNGNLSNPAFFNKVLSQDEILTIYNGGVPNSLSSLSPTGWWSLAGDSYYDGTNWICPDLGSGGNNGTSANMAGTELVGDAPGGSANGTATNMDIPANLKGDAPNSSSNAFSVNMDTADRVASVPS